MPGDCGRDLLRQGAVRGSRLEWRPATPAETAERAGEPDMNRVLVPYGSVAGVAWLVPTSDYIRRGHMGRRAVREAAAVTPIDLAEERERRAAEAQMGEYIRRALARMVASVAARWRGHEPEIAALATTTLILAVAATFAGADLLFTLLVVLVAGAVIWSPWRQPG